ncbi:hypothetical protein JR316_0006546 [Psilocybe cubensis]|uniref:Uncharacterized protein n=1 Tax=Psilocybe cubensis TaxID=181762 RepID=A0ACB8H2C1_PSICU|nr:hypothetical protein JR316_0006546 [Psilocybe cubensis]KAH9482016.1 hypothetical protein JR316_0006546 [Psilocybe cubensis]
MSTPEVPLPVSLQQRLISANVGSSMLFNFLMALFVTETALSGLLGPDASDAQAALGNNISSALVFVSLGTTVSTTFLIGYRVHTASRLNVLHRRQAFNYVINMIVESAAAYTVVLLLWAIIIIIPSTSFIQSPFSEADLYIQVVLGIVAGMAPTVLVARIALKNSGGGGPSHVASAQISALDFYSSHGTRQETDASERITYETSDATEELKNNYNVTPMLG